MNRRLEPLPVKTDWRRLVGATCLAIYPVFFAVSIYLCFAT